MSFLQFLSISVISVFGLTFLFLYLHHKKIESMPPEEKSNYLFGKINEDLVCPHCQTRGTVRTKGVMRTETSEGKIGGILTTKTTNTTSHFATQRHCDKCNSTWDI